MSENDSSYSSNNESPLLVYKAWLEIEEKNFNKALLILAEAIKKFPFYPTAYFIYAMAFAHNREITLAKEMISKGDSLLGEHSTADYYYQLIENISKDEEEQKPIFEDTINEILNETFLDQNIYADIEDIELFNEVEDLKLDKANFNQPNKIPIITETMAEIYFSQNKFEEAIDVYTKLIDLKPEQSNKFNQRIFEIQNKIESLKNKIN